MSPDILRSEDAPVYLVKDFNEFPHIESPDILNYIDSIFVLEQDYSAYVLQCLVNDDGKAVVPVNWSPTIWWNYPASILLKRKRWLGNVGKETLDTIAKLEYDTLIEMVN